MNKKYTNFIKEVIECDVLSHCAKPPADLNLFPCHSEPFTTHFNVTLGFKPFTEQRGNVLINNVTNL